VVGVSNKVMGAMPLGPRVVSVEPMKNFQLLVEFTNGERRSFDARQLFGYPAFERLKNEEFFKLAKVAYGTVTWPEGIDYCPDTLYIESTHL
jgi:hypothetical protein